MYKLLKIRKLSYLNLLFFIFIMGVKIEAQNCVESDKIDKFTKIRIIETKQVKVGGTSPVAVVLLDLTKDYGYYLSFIKKGEFFYLAFTDEGLYHSLSVPESITFLLSTGKLLTVSNFESEGVTGNVLDHREYERSLSKINIELINELSENRITDIRYNFNGNTTDKTVPIKVAEKIQKMANCILNF